MGKMQISLNPEDLIPAIGTAACPRVVDVRRAEAFGAATEALPGAVWRHHRDAGSWGRALDCDAGVVVYCVHGHQVSQCAAALLRSQGINARYLAGGIDAYREAGGILVKTSPGLQDRETDASDWVAPSGADLDYLAHVWFIRRFLDPAARLHFVEPTWVDEVAAELGGRAIPTKDSGQPEYGGLNEFFRCHGTGDAVLQVLAGIVETAEDSREDLLRPAAGLSAMIEGVSRVFGDDAARVSAALPVFDALYAGCRWRASNGAIPERS